METEVVIRDATLDDCGVIASIYNEYIEMGGSTMDRELKSAEDIKGWMNNFNERELIQCLELKGGVVGWGIIKRYSDRLGYSKACETAIYIRQDKLRMGLGSRLKVSIIDKCRVLGYHHLVAKIFASNIASIEYNRKLGYEVVGTQREVGNIDGKWLDVTIMQLLL